MVRHLNILLLGTLLTLAGCSGTHYPLQDAGLQLHQRGENMKNADLTLVLLHGYGSQGDDLTGLARVLMQDTATSFIFPAGPLSLPSGGKAWNRPDGSGFEESRDLVLKLLKQIHSNNPRTAIIVGGFSQGATLASNLFSEDLPYLQGSLLFSPSLVLLHTPRSSGPLPPVFISHGRLDRVLPFSGGEKLRDVLRSYGYQVEWFPFDGGHTISTDAIDSTNAFLSMHFGD